MATAPDDQPAEGLGAIGIPDVTDVDAASESALRVASSEPVMPVAPDRASLLQAELEKMLSTAEALQEKCDRLSSRVEFVNMVGLVTFFIGVGFAGWIAIRFTLSYLFPASAVLIAGLVLIGNANTIGKRRLQRDVRALQSIVNLLRETEGAAAMHGLWTPFQLAQFRIRLARFDMQPPG